MIFNLFKDEVFEQMLPESIKKPRAFETVGHIARFNLSGDLAPYKHVIGHIILDVL